MFIREALIDILEVACIGGSVIRRQAHAEQQHFDTAAQGFGDDSIKIVIHILERQSAQTVVRAQFEYKDIGVMTLQQQVDTIASSGSGLATNAGIDYPRGDAPLLQALSE